MRFWSLFFSAVVEEHQDEHQEVQRRHLLVRPRLLNSLSRNKSKYTRRSASLKKKATTIAALGQMVRLFGGSNQGLDEIR